jgi:hypothetical protein
MAKFSSGRLLATSLLTKLGKIAMLLIILFHPVFKGGWNPMSSPGRNQFPSILGNPEDFKIQGSRGKVNWLLEYISRSKASLLFSWTADSIRSTQSGISFTVTVVSYCYRQDSTHTVRSKSKQQNYCTIVGSVDCGPETNILTCLHTPKNNCFNT